MSFSINTNLGALTAYNALAKVNDQTQKAQTQLATGQRINSSGDDTSGYRVGKELQSKIALMTSAQGNIDSAKNMLSTAESALSNVNDLLTQIKGEVGGANDPSKNLTSISKDVLAMGDEISSIFTNTKFNDTSLLTGASSSLKFKFSTGAQTSDNITLDLSSLNSLDLSSITSAGTGHLTSATVANVSVDSLQTAVEDALGTIGNYNQRLDVKSNYLTTAISNAQASVSKIFDADMAMGQLDSTKGSIAGQVSTSMLSQLNSAPSQIMKLFQ
jgi:flagellin